MSRFDGVRNSAGRIRLHVGGLHEDVDEKTLRMRFDPFVEVVDVSIARQQFGDRSKCRGFGHVEVSGEDDAIKRCMSIIHGSRWKGKMLSVALANASFLEKLRKEIEERKESEEQGQSLQSTPPLPSPNTDALEDAERQQPKSSLSSADSLVIRKGRGRGKAKLNLTKLKRLHHVRFDSDESMDEMEDVVPKLKKQKRATENSAIAADKKELSAEDRRREAVEARQREKEKQKELIKQSLSSATVDRAVNKTNKMVFDSDEDEKEQRHKHRGSLLDSDEETEDSEAFDDSGLFAKKGSRAFSDGDNSEDEGLRSEELLSHKKVFVGEEGQKLLSLQREYQGDERFKLDERFRDEPAQEEEEEDNKIGGPSTAPAGADDEYGLEEVDLEKEKKSALSILSSMFEDSSLAATSTHEKKDDRKRDSQTEAVDSEDARREMIIRVPRGYVKETALAFSNWGSAFARYDPTNEDAAAMEAVSNSANEGEAVDDETDEKKAPDVVVGGPGVAPLANTELRFEVNADFESIFKAEKTGNAEAASFRLFGDNVEDTENESAGFSLSGLFEAKGSQEKEPETSGVEDAAASEANEAIDKETSQVGHKASQIAFFTTQHSQALFREAEVVGEQYRCTEEYDALLDLWRRIRGNLTEDFRQKMKEARKKRSRYGYSSLKSLPFL